MKLYVYRGLLNNRRAFVFVEGDWTTTTVRTLIKITIRALLDYRFFFLSSIFQLRIQFSRMQGKKPERAKRGGEQKKIEYFIR